MSRVRVQAFWRRRVGRILHRETEFSRLLAAAATDGDEMASFEPGIQAWLARICDCGHWPLGHLHLRDETIAAFVSSDVWHVRPLTQLRAPRPEIDVSRFRAHEEWHDRVAASARPVCIGDLIGDLGFGASDAVGEFGLKSVLGLPVRIRGRTVAICEFFSYDYLQADRLFIEVMTAIAWMLSRAIETRLAEEAVRDLTRRFLGLQDEERRRLAGELHDTTAQNMASLVMYMGTLSKEADAFNPTARERLSKCENLAHQSLQAIRTFSYQLYPPMLDELGLRSALGVFTEGFSERSGLRVDLELAQLQRLPKDFEIAIFRIVQEGLTNVHRHSNSSFARVAIKFERNTIQVRVEDDGTTPPAANRDIPEAPKVGVGLANMRARVKQFGGEVRLNLHPTGTVLQATLPLTEAARAATA